MHSLEANALPAGRFFAAKCRRDSKLPYFGCCSAYFWGRISLKIDVATPNLVSLKRSSVPFVLPNLKNKHYRHGSLFCWFLFFLLSLFQQSNERTRNSSGDEITNVNFLYDDIVDETTTYNRLVNKFRHRSTRLCVETQVYQSEWNNATQRPLRRSRSFKVTDFGTNRKIMYEFLIVTLICTVSKSWSIIGHIFASGRGVPHFNALTGVIPC